MEQNQIIVILADSLAVILNVENKLNHSTEVLERLRENILRKAFEGKLVSQDPYDEPAKKLLERIKQEI